ncbi:MAG: HAMP domain-containing histidine kinase, partial [Alphaproteobacteria bacterium]|nr:HAMP domain-containing histidine kinase [Alphaproteobacteria bacterium]
KTELTSQKLFTTIIAALRSYQDIVTIENSRRDISALKLMEEQLRSSKEETEGTLTQLRQAQDGLIQAEKMAALGSLVAGIAHEINTPIGTALTSASYLSERTTELRRNFEANQLKRSDLARYLGLASETTRLMLTNIERAAELVQSFKQVAVDQTSSERRRFDLRTYLGEVLLSLRPRLRRTKITVAVDCPDNIEVDGDPGALSHVVTNFVLNSLLHAFQPNQPGRIRIAVTQPTPNEIRLRYSDDGAGIPPDIIGRIFEPFFTTRRGSGGSGLGLHIVYNMVTRNLHGRLKVTSELGKGATFDLEFPLRLPAEAGMTISAAALSLSVR